MRAITRSTLPSSSGPYTGMARLAWAAPEPVGISPSGSPTSTGSPTAAITPGWRATKRLAVAPASRLPRRQPRQRMNTAAARNT